MSRRPTGRGIIVTVVGAMILLVGATAQAGWLFVLAVGVLGAVLGSPFVPHRLASLWVERTIPERAVAGDAITITLTVTNRGSKPSPLVRIEDVTCGLPVVCEGLAPGAIATTTATRHAPRRGVFEGGMVRISCGAPFGFVSSVRTVNVESPIVVVPRSVDLESVAFIAGGTESDEGGGRVRMPSGDYVGVREYRAGDSRRAVHWRSSARAGTLVVREFDEAVAPRVALVIHGSGTGTPPDSPFEAVVAAAASIARHLSDAGRQVQLVRSGPEGPEHLFDARSQEILRWLAGCEPSGGRLAPAVQAALARCERNASVVVLTTTDGRTAADVSSALDHIVAAGSHPAIVMARSATWTQSRAEDERAVLSAAHGRAPVRVLARGEDLATCLNG